jgi:microcystin-dependent protein
MATIKISQLSELTADTDVTSNDLLQIINIEQTSSTYPTGTNRKIKASTLANGLSRLSTTIPQVIQDELDSKVSLENFNSAGLKIAIPVVAASPGINFTLSNITPSSSMDGVTLASGNRVLLKDQSAPAQNGIYVVQTTGSPLRATDFNEVIEINDGYVLVDGGNTLKGSSWVVTSDVAVVGTDPIVFTQFSSAISGLSKSAVGLGNVDNTSDLNKPISTDTATALNLKANILNPTFSGTVGGITKSMVGLGNVDNTSDLNKPISTDTATALNLKANLASPIFSGNVALPSTTTVGGTTISFVPAGAVMAFAMGSAPAGWLWANGQAVDRAGASGYPALFAAIGTTYGAGNNSTTFNLPDLRGYFVRAWGTNGDGTTTGAFGAKQSQMFQDHTHNGYTDVQGNHTHTYTEPRYDKVDAGSDGTKVAQVQTGTTSASGAHSHNVYTHGVNAGWWTAGGETRPANIAMLYCIKF